jgi:signal transduction histidine kinase/ligand-binding sensor domain-containing protein
VGRIFAALVLLICATRAFALDPRKNFSQYSRTMWTQERGLPQDTIRAITQTSDGYLWLGTDEGLARFDGYEFVVFNKASGSLPDNSITALAAGRDGVLWIGTQNGLVEYLDGKFRVYSAKQGLPDPSITNLYADPSGALWLVAGLYLSRFQDGHFTTYQPEVDIPVSSVRVASQDSHGNLWVAGFSRVVKRTGNRFVTVLSPEALSGTVVLAMLVDRHDHVWIGANNGAIELLPDGTLRKYGVREGLPDPSVRALWADRDGNVWGGTNKGVVRLEGSRFVTSGATSEEGGPVRCLFEDREGNLWIGTNGGLIRWRNDIFTVYGRTEGLPSDEPNVVFQDRAGRIWVGFNDAGLMQFAEGSNRTYSTADGLPDSEILQIRETPNADLLIATRRGVSRFSGGRFRNFEYPDPLSRHVVFDAMERPDGQLWLATPAGLGILSPGAFKIVVPGGPLLVDFVLTLCETRDGAVWAGTFGKGLWRVKGSERQQFTTSDGLSSDQIRSLYQDPDGTLWIATFGGGLDAYRGGKFTHYRAQDGLLSDNVGKLLDDGASLWLSTTRGICRVPKQQFAEMDSGRRQRLEPENFGVEDGLRSAQSAPAYPVSGGGMRAADGRLYFTTGRGMAVLDPGARKAPAVVPVTHFVEMTANSDVVDLLRAARLAPGSERLQIRYTGIYLSAPDRVQYSYRLVGVDPTWVDAGARRVINYNNVPHGSYRFTVRAQLPGGPASEQSYAFEVLPQFWETAWFRVLAAAALALMAWAVYQMRLRQIRSRFAAVLEERARLAREIHDTLAQGFVGISSQLDAVALSMPSESSPARNYLDLARRMARHSLTEARRSVMDLRSSALEGQDLAAAIQSGTKMWAAGSGVEVEVDIDGPSTQLPEEMEQHLLRIAQEAVTNVLKHAGASKIAVRLHMEARKLYLRIVDDGRGFEQENAFSSRGGHFGLIGMRERAERLGGELRLSSHPGEGTELEVTVPLP